MKSRLCLDEILGLRPQMKSFAYAHGEIRTRPARQIKDLGRVPRNLVAHFVRNEIRPSSREAGFHREAISSAEGGFHPSGRTDFIAKQHLLSQVLFCLVAGEGLEPTTSGL